MDSATPQKLKEHEVTAATKASEDTPEKDIVLSHKEAEAASPDDNPVCGEEDPGEALEGLVNHEDR